MVVEHWVPYCVKALKPQTGTRQLLHGWSRHMEVEQIQAIQGDHVALKILVLR